MKRLKWLIPVAIISIALVMIVCEEPFPPEVQEAKSKEKTDIGHALLPPDTTPFETCHAYAAPADSSDTIFVYPYEYEEDSIPEPQSWQEFNEALNMWKGENDTVKVWGYYDGYPCVGLMGISWAKEMNNRIWGHITRKREWMGSESEIINTQYGYWYEWFLHVSTEIDRCRGDGTGCRDFASGAHTVHNEAAVLVDAWAKYCPWTTFHWNVLGYHAVHGIAVYSTAAPPGEVQFQCELQCQSYAQDTN